MAGGAAISARLTAAAHLAYASGIAATAQRENNAAAAKTASENLFAPWLQPHGGSQRKRCLPAGSLLAAK